MQVISVVRDFDMYNKLVKNNTYYGQNTNFVAFDNNEENKYISVRYNDFLRNYDYSVDDWFVFCHEDWELKEPLDEKLANLDKNCLYGPIGMSMGDYFKKATVLGSVIQSDKKGDDVIRVGVSVGSDNSVGTFDCQCLIVHSSIIKKFGLRFDENLSFDLYVEDFCINARERYDVCSKIIPLECQHYSYGNVTQRFYEQLKYLQKKYKKVHKIYCTVVKGEAISSQLICFIYEVCRFIYQSKITKKGNKIVKVCKIPVFRKSK